MTYTYRDDEGNLVPVWGKCGIGGWLCHACRADRADTRTDRLVEGLALAGLLADPTIGDAKEYGDTAKYARRYVAALRREREGGDDDE